MYTDIVGTTGENPTGLSQVIYFAPISDFLIVQDPLPGENVIVTDHSFKTGKGFLKIELHPDTAGFTGEDIGESMSKMIGIPLTGKVKGITPAIAKVLDNAKNDYFIVIAEDIENGNVYQLGNRRNTARIIATPMTGTSAPEGEKGYMINIRVNQSKLVFYDGEIIRPTVPTP